MERESERETKREHESGFFFENDFFKFVADILDKFGLIHYNRIKTDFVDDFNVSFNLI